MRLKDVKSLFAEIFPDCQTAFDRARDLREIKTIIVTRNLVVQRATSTAAPAPAPRLYDLLLTSCGPNKIGVIKAVRNITELGLKEAKDLVDASEVGRSQEVLSGASLDRIKVAERELRMAGAGFSRCDSLETTA